MKRGHLRKEQNILNSFHVQSSELTQDEHCAVLSNKLLSSFFSRAKYFRQEYSAYIYCSITDAFFNGYNSRKAQL